MSTSDYADYDRKGVCVSVCHTLKLYQNGTS